jgi:hypothetical protein
VEHRGAEDLRVGYARAANKHLERLQEVLGVRRTSRPLLIAVEGSREVGRLAQPGHGAGGQPLTQPGFGLLPRVPGGEELHVSRC